MTCAGTSHSDDRADPFKGNGSHLFRLGLRVDARFLSSIDLMASITGGAASIGGEQLNFARSAASRPACRRSRVGTPRRPKSSWCSRPESSARAVYVGGLLQQPCEGVEEFGGTVVTPAAARADPRHRLDDDAAHVAALICGGAS
jgi:hypothetical protein